MYLVSNEFEIVRAFVWISGAVESVGAFDDVVGVDAGFAVERLPELTRHIEEECLENTRNAKLSIYESTKC